MPKFKFWGKGSKKDPNQSSNAQQSASQKGSKSDTSHANNGKQSKESKKSSKQNKNSNSGRRRRFNIGDPAETGLAASGSGSGAATNSANTDKNVKRVLIEVKRAQTDEMKEAGDYTKTDLMNNELPLIRSIQDIDKKKAIVTRKLRLCSVLYTFDSQDEKDMRGIERKRQMLVEIVEFISSHKWWDEDLLKELISCMDHNLFRALPKSNKRNLVKGDEEEEPFQDPQWAHLQLVYELCLRFLISNDIDKKVMQQHLLGRFIFELIKLFESEDMRERDYLKTILHRIYGRFMPLRQQIRNSIADECYNYIYGNTRSVNGLAEFLDIFSSIINGFSVPVKEEHKNFLRNVLVPLHKCEKYETYFQQLADCCVLFVNKEQSIAPVIIGGLVKFWPVLAPTKQAFFLREMLSVIGALVEHENGFSYDKYRTILLCAMEKMIECMSSDHFQVADTTLTIWKDTVMIFLSKCEKDYVWRRLFAIFNQNSKAHWHEGIRQLTSEIAQYYEAIDNEYWHELTIEYKASVQEFEKKTARKGRSLGLVENRTAKTSLSNSSPDPTTLDTKENSPIQTQQPSLTQHTADGGTAGATPEKEETTTDASSTNPNHLMPDGGITDQSTTEDDDGPPSLPRSVSLIVEEEIEKEKKRREAKAKARAAKWQRIRELADQNKPST